MTIERRTPRVLVVAYDFPPHAAIGTMRTLRVIRQLVTAGWDVTVLTSDPDSYLPTTPVDQALMDKVPPGVRILRAGSIRAWEGAQRRLLGVMRGRPSAERAVREAEPAAASSGPPRTGLIAQLARAKDVVDAALAIPDREIGWLMPALVKGMTKQLGAHRPDVIYASSPPWTGMLVATGLKAALRCPLVADFRDPWGRAPWRGDRYRFWLQASSALERRVVKAADRIVFVARGNHDDFAAQYGAATASKFHVVSNGCDPSEFDAAERPTPPDGVHVMLHAGSLYAGRTPMPLLKAIAAAIAGGLIHPDRFRLRFLGANGLKTVDLPAACRELGLEGVVEFAPRVPRAESIRAMVSASSLLLLQPGHTVSVPGKVYEYLAAGRPILSIAEEESETAAVVRESGLGVSVGPDDDAGVTKALAAILEMARRPVTPAPRDSYDGNLGASRIEEILRGAIEPPLAALIDRSSSRIG